jgi:hypothetical protein
VKRLLLILAPALGLVACTDPAPSGEGFDRRAWLQHQADAHLRPAYAAWAEASARLDSALAAFTDAPDAARLDAARTALAEARLAWQAVAPFDFGPAMDRGLAVATNRFPTDTARIGNLIEAGTWNLDEAGNADAQGLPALDFLLHAGGDAAVLDAFTDRPSRGAFAAEAAARLAADAAAVADAWETYREPFAAADGVDVGSSAGQLVNAANRYLERDLRDGKIGIPLGVRSLGVPIPDAVEGRFAGGSSALAREALVPYRLLLDGNGGPGLRDWLDAVDARYGDIPLSTELDDALQAAEAALAALPEPLDEAVVTDPAPVEAAHTALQRFLIGFKVDLPSALGILITYQDNDGD